MSKEGEKRLVAGVVRLVVLAGVGGFSVPLKFFDEKKRAQVAKLYRPAVKNLGKIAPLRSPSS